jgi:putative ABC transport system permease protein
MSRPRADPPVLALALLRRCLPHDVSEFVIGDLEEDFRDVVLPARGRRAARRWFWAQTARCLAARRARPATIVQPGSNGGMSMESMTKDLRHSLRLLRKNPGFALVAVLTLALGIGAAVAIFSLVDALLLRPVSYPEPERLVVVRDLQADGRDTASSFPEFRDWRQLAGGSMNLAAYFNTTYTLSGGGEPETVWAVRSSANLLSLLGVRPLLGRGLSPTDEPPEAPRVVLISHGLWQRRFGGEARVVGSTITLSDEPWTIVGVLPPGVRSVLPREAGLGRTRDVWVPLRLDDTRAPRSLHFLRVVGRLRPGIAAAAAGARLDDSARRLTGQASTAHGALVRPLVEEVSRGSRPVLIALLAAVAVLLIITCANLASLLLARTMQRRHELAMRLALGAGRGRLARQLLAESFVLALAGGVAGLAVAVTALRLFASSDASAMLGSPAIGLNGPVLLFAVGLTLATGLVFGLGPAWQAARPNLQDLLRASPTRSAAGGVRIRSALVAAEIGLSVVLLAAAALLARSFVGLIEVEKGFDTARVVTFDLALARSRYPEPPAQARAFERVLEELGAIPGVDAAGMVNVLPLSGGGVSGGTRIQGIELPPDQTIETEKRIVSPDYFRAMGIPVLRGRSFSDRDRRGAPPVAIVSDSFVAQYLKGRNPLGSRVDFLWDTEGWQEIVGVVGDVRHYGLDDPPAPTLYVPYLQRPDSGFTLVIRSSASAESTVRAARRAIASIDPNQPLTDVQTYERIVEASVGDRRLSMVLVAGFALVALLVTAVGLYGVLSYTVRQRTREIGVRIALGARPSHVLRQVVRQGLALTIFGIAAGLAAALAATRLLRSQLFEVSPTDPAALGASVATLGAVALLASWLPARRATRVDPMTALRDYD